MPWLLSLPPDFVESKWCDQEVGFCIARGLLIVPMSLGVNPHGFIGKYQRMDAREDERSIEVAERLFDLLIGHELTQAKLARPAAQKYARSYSFDNARKNFEMLKSVPQEL